VSLITVTMILVLVAPYALLALAGLLLWKRHRSVATMMIALGFAYWQVAREPLRYRPYVTLGMIGKLCFAQSFIGIGSTVRPHRDLLRS